MLTFRVAHFASFANGHKTEWFWEADALRRAAPSLVRRAGDASGHRRFEKTPGLPVAAGGSRYETAASI